MIKFLRYRKQIRALEYIRDNNVSRRDVKRLFGEVGVQMLEAAVGQGAVFLSTMGVQGRKADKMSTIIEEYKNEYYDYSLSLIKRLVALLVGGITVSLCIHVTINIFN